MKKLQRAAANRTPVVLKCSRKADEKHTNTSFISAMSERINASKHANNTVADHATRRSQRSRMNSGRRARLNSSTFQSDWGRVGDPEILDDVVVLDVDLDSSPRYYDRQLRSYFYDNNPKNLQADLEDALSAVLPNHLPFHVDRHWNVVVDADLSHLYDLYDEDPNFDPLTDPLYCDCLDLTAAIDRIIEEWNHDDEYDETVQRVLGDPDAEGLRDYWRSAF